MYAKAAYIYDAIYAAVGKDYAQEVDQIEALIRAHKRAPGNRLLDVACGTGLHLDHLKARFEVEGLDLEPAMLERAGERIPDVPLHHGSMLDFELDRTFDIVICLFSAIGYVQTEESLNQAVGTMSRHLNPGGVLIVEPWFTPDEYHAGTVHATYGDEPDLKIARMNVSQQMGNLAVMEMHYLVGTPEGIEYFNELHELGLFEHESYLEAFRSAGLDVEYDEDGLIGRGLYIGGK